ncbi:MAG: hypothetical protein EOP51_11200 [Sphingobacteriales bacterium]|nr:MAG: hypothetical protein EOP51_11200 [Sphingobacteriales bacterium]
MITEKFLPAERRLLNRRLQLYGTIADCAARTGIHRSTIARVLKTGEASQTTIDKLRLYMNNKSKLEVNR